MKSTFLTKIKAVLSGKSFLCRPSSFSCPPSKGSDPQNSHPELVSGSSDVNKVPNQVRDDRKMDSRLRGNDKLSGNGKSQGNEENRLTAQDILPMEVYGRKRQEIRVKLSAFKAQRRVAIGPFAGVMFEHYDTIWQQVHEMLYVEKAGHEQIQEEIDAYASLMPGSGRLTFTLMFEVEDPQERLAFLRSLTGVEETLALQWADQEVKARPVDAQERTREGDGKTSAVHFMELAMTPKVRESFANNEGSVKLVIKHPNYAQEALLPSLLVSMLRSEVIKG